MAATPAYRNCKFAVLVHCPARRSDTMLTEVFQGFLYLILTNVMICLLSGYFIDSGQATAFGEWEGCPVNIATYAGCNVTLKAYFNVKDNNIMCSEAFIQFGVIDGNNNVQLKKSVSFGVNGSNDVCEVITVLDNVTPGVREVIFSAVRLVPPDSETLTCDDLLSIKAGTLPFNDDDVVISKTSSVEANITWTTPNLYTPYNDLEGYLVTIQDNQLQNMTYFQTSDNTITVTNVTTGSCVQINAIYCGGQYSESVLLPLISDGDQEIAAPENVTVNLDCNDKLSIEWSAPSGSLQDYHVDYYTITINDFNLTISTEMTSIEVTLNEMFLSSLYSFEVNVTFTICGWSSKASVTEVDIVPMNFDLVNYRILVLNESHGSVLLKHEAACKGSYSVSASFECNNGVGPVVNQSSVVNVQNNDDQVTLNYILPLNQTCNGIFTWSRNKKHITFNMIIETLSPLNFTTLAINAEFGLQYLCLFKCCDVHYGVSQTSEGGCISLETSFAVLTDDSACDGYFTLRCDNFTVIGYNQTTPSKTAIPTTHADTVTSSLMHSCETSATPTSENEEINRLCLVISVIAAVLFVCLAISCLIIIFMMILFKRRKGARREYAVDGILLSKQAQEVTARYERGVNGNSPEVSIDEHVRGNESDDKQPTSNNSELQDNDNDNDDDDDNNNSNKETDSLLLSSISGKNDSTKPRRRSLSSSFAEFQSTQNMIKKTTSYDSYLTQFVDPHTPNDSLNGDTAKKIQSSKSKSKKSIKMTSLVRMNTIDEGEDSSTLLTQTQLTLFNPISED